VWCGLCRDAASDCTGPFTHWSGVGENEVLHVCGVDAEATWGGCIDGVVMRTASCCVAG
jgi:hypothetical protein